VYGHFILSKGGCIALIERKMRIAACCLCLGGLDLDVVDIAELASIPKITGAARNLSNGRALL